MARDYRLAAVPRDPKGGVPVAGMTVWSQRRDRALRPPGDHRRGGHLHAAHTALPRLNLLRAPRATRWRTRSRLLRVARVPAGGRRPSICRGTFLVSSAGEDREGVIATRVVSCVDVLSLRHGARAPIPEAHLGSCSGGSGCGSSPARCPRAHVRARIGPHGRGESMAWVSAAATSRIWHSTSRHRLMPMRYRDDSASAYAVMDVNAPQLRLRLALDRLGVWGRGRRCWFWRTALRAPSPCDAADEPFRAPVGQLTTRASDRIWLYERGCGAGARTPTT